MDKLIRIAQGVALSRIGKQEYKLGASGLRADGKIVIAHNTKATDRTWNTHAETRLCRKLTPKSVVAVIRVIHTGTMAMAKPCKSCETCLRRIGVVKVYYSISDNEFGVLYL